MSNGPWMQTYTGATFYPLHAESLDVRIEDIEHALAHQCRFGGHCREFYSIAQHCVLASYIVPKHDAFAALMHDSPEAYVGDVPRPLKMCLGNDYKHIERGVARVVGKRFGVDLVSLPYSVKRADLVLLATERRDLMTHAEVDWDPLPDPLIDTIIPWEPREAKRIFRARFDELYRDLSGGIDEVYRR